MMREMKLAARGKSRLDPIIEAVLMALLVYAPAAFGVVYAVDEFFAFVACALLGLLLVVRVALHPPTFWRAWLWLPIAIFITVVCFQLLPMSAGAVRAISSNTAGLKTELLGDLPNASDVLSRMTLSFYPLATRHDLRIVLMAVTVLSAVVIVYRDLRRIRRLLWTITIIGGALGLLALAQDVTRTHSIYWLVQMNEPARAGTFANHSHFSQFMNLCIGAAAALLLMTLNSDPDDWRSMIPRPVAIAAPAGTIILGLATISLSHSRGGMVAVAGAGLFALLTLMTMRHMRWLGGAMALLGVATVVVLCFFGIESVQQRLGQRGGMDTRLQIIKDCWVIAQQFPTFGVGLGTFASVYPIYDRTAAPTITEYAENEYAQVLTEMGWIGLVVVLAWMGIIGWRWVLALRSEDRAVAAAAVGLGYGLVAVMIHSLTDFGQHLPANGCLSAVVCGLIINLSWAEREPQPARNYQRAGAIAIGALACLAFVWLTDDAYWTWQAQRRWTGKAYATTTQEPTDPSGTAARLARAQGAIAAMPDNAYYRYRGALFRWRQSRRTREDNDPQLIPEAKQVVAELNEARRYGPTYGPIYSVLAQIEVGHLDMPIGLTHMELASRLEPNDSLIQYLTGRMEAQRGNDEKAVAKFKQAVNLDTEIMADVIDAAIELKKPQIALAVGEVGYQRMIEVSAALQKSPEHVDLGKQAFRRAVEMLEQRCASPDASSWDLGRLGDYQGMLENYQSSEQAYARALEYEPTNIWWRMGRAESLYKLRRSAEAIEEAQRAVRQHPDSADAKRLLERVSRPL